jgi:hypothetical protein
MVEVNGRQTPKELADKDNNNKAPQTGGRLSTNAVKPCLNLSHKKTRAIRGMEGRSYKKGGARELLLPATKPPPHLTQPPPCPLCLGWYVQSFVPVRRHPLFCNFVMLGCTVEERKRHCVCHSCCHCGIKDHCALPSLHCLYPPPRPQNCQHHNGAGIHNPCYHCDTHQTTLAAPERCARSVSRQILRSYLTGTPPLCVPLPALPQ